MNGGLALGGWGKNLRTAMMALVLFAAGLCGGCENMSTGQKGALVGAALGTGIAAAAGGPFGVVMGAGLIGGAAGFLGGEALESNSLETR